MSTQNLAVSPQSLINIMFQFIEGRTRSHRRFVEEMILGILGSQSTVLANIARFLGEPVALKYTEKRLSRMLGNKAIAWDGLRDRLLEVNSRLVGTDDVIAFDPGDLSKDFATEMEHIYRVHDGSQNDVANGFEDFSAEAVQWRDGRKFHVPLYQKLITASCPDYISQNRQINDAIHAIYGQLGQRGIWTFDRGHDRSRIYEKSLFILDMRWIVRVKENRSVIPDDRAFLDNGKDVIGLIDLALKLPLSESTSKLIWPKKSGPVHVAWHGVTIKIKEVKKELTVVVIKDVRNQNPLVLLTNLPVQNEDDAMSVFAHYLERWGKEEGYRFTKSFLNSEDIRTLKWESTQNLAFLSFMTYSFITWFYRASPDQVEKLAEQRLRHFHKIKDIKYKYYRIGQLARLLLCEQRGCLHALPLMTEVG